jgi:hypothetical protein
MQATRDLALGIGSARANAGINATLEFSQNQNNFDQAMAQFQQQLDLTRRNTRLGFMFGGGLQGAGAIGQTEHSVGNSTTIGKASGFQQVMGGFQMANSALDLGGRIGSMGMGMGGATPSSLMGAGA